MPELMRALIRLWVLDYASADLHTRQAARKDLELPQLDPACYKPSWIIEAAAIALGRDPLFLLAAIEAQARAGYSRKRAA